MARRWARALALVVLWLHGRAAEELPDYYKTLSLPRDASPEDIKDAYRKVHGTFVTRVLSRG